MPPVELRKACWGQLVWIVIVCRPQRLAGQRQVRREPAQHVVGEEALVVI